MAEQEEDVQSPIQLRVFSIVESPPQLKLQLLYKQVAVHSIPHMLPLQRLVQWPPQVSIGPQELPQEDIHALVHTLEHPELPHPRPHVVKQPLVQLLKHQLEQSLVGP